MTEVDGTGAFFRGDIRFLSGICYPGLEKDDLVRVDSELLRGRKRSAKVNTIGRGRLTLKRLIVALNLLTPIHHSISLKCDLEVISHACADNITLPDSHGSATCQHTWTPSILKRRQKSLARTTSQKTWRKICTKQKLEISKEPQPALISYRILKQAYTLSHSGSAGSNFVHIMQPRTCRK